MPATFADRLYFGQFPEWSDFVASLTLPGTAATAPDTVTLPGYTRIFAPGFTGAGVVPEVLTGTFELMHDYSEGSDLSPHIHFVGSSNNAGAILWQLAYAIFAPGAEGTAEATLTALANNPGLGPNGRPITGFAEFPFIDAHGLKIGTQIRFAIFRDPAHVSDTYPDDAIPLDVGMHYLSDTIGSVERGHK